MSRALAAAIMWVAAGCGGAGGDAALPDAAPPVQSCFEPDPGGPATGVSIGAIRWDAWFYEPEIPPLINRLSFWAHQWFDRVPIDAMLVDGKWSVAHDRQPVVDREIDYAATRGIDFWAFDYNRFVTLDFGTGEYPDISRLKEYQLDNYRGGNFLQLYLASDHCKKPRFSLVLGSDSLNDFLNTWRPGATASQKEQAWQYVLEDIAPYLARPEQQKTPDGRPIVFFIMGSRWGVVWRGDAMRAKDRLEELRQAAVNLGAERPFLVTLDTPDDAASAIASYGFDGAGSYGWNAGLNPSGTGEEVPWSQADFDVDWVARTDVFYELDTIPPVISGWDYRPEIPFVDGRDPAGNWFPRATNEQFIGQLDHAIQFVKANPTYATTKTVLIYAWNELAEGGYIMPTLADGSSRLDAVAAYVGKIIPPTAPVIPPVVIPTVTRWGTGCDGGYGIWVIGSSFDADSYIQLRPAQVGDEDVVATHTDPTRDVAPDGQSLSVCLTGAGERAAFAGNGLRVSVVNPERPSTSRPVVVRLGD